MLGMTNSADFIQLISAISEGLHVIPGELKLSQVNETKDLNLVYSASTLLAVGASSAASRTALIVRNNGKNRILVGKSSATEIYEEGIPVEPGELKVFTLSSAIDLYGRTSGYACSVTVWEV